MFKDSMIGPNLNKMRTEMSSTDKQVQLARSVHPSIHALVREMDEASPPHTEEILASASINGNPHFLFGQVIPVYYLYCDLIEGPLHAR